MLIEEQIRRMRRRTMGKLPAAEQEELAALLEDMLRTHPVLSRWAQRLLPPPQVLESGAIASDGEGRPSSTPGDAAPGAAPAVPAARKMKKSGSTK